MWLKTDYRVTMKTPTEARQRTALYIMRRNSKFRIVGVPKCVYFTSQDQHSEGASDSDYDLYGYRSCQSEGQVDSDARVPKSDVVIASISQHFDNNHNNNNKSTLLGLRNPKY